MALDFTGFQAVFGFSKLSMARVKRLSQFEASLDIFIFPNLVRGYMGGWREVQTLEEGGRKLKRLLVLTSPLL